MQRRRATAGFSLIELLIVIAIIGILTALAIPSTSTAVHDQVKGAALMVATDLDYARALALGNNSSYRVTFDIAENRYRLQHVGTNSQFDTLPASPLRVMNQEGTEQIFDFEHQALAGGFPPRLLGTTLVGNAITFEPLGAPNRNALPNEMDEDGNVVVCWLTAGEGDAQRYMPVRINPITGLTSIGDIQATDPAGF